MTTKARPETSAYRIGTARRPVAARRANPFALLIALALALAIGATMLVTAVAGSLGGPSSSAMPPTGGEPIPGAGPARDGDDAVDGDGRVGAGVSVFDDGEAAVANLDPVLLDAVRRAATDAEAEGIAFVVNSGWRSAEYQEELLRDAVAEYGSAEEAARWVATAETSPHVQGDAIDLGEWQATSWLSEHGAAYGLCQIYANESWHFELRPAAVADGCPEPYADPTEDPRMQR
ncbi:M15 family metallopeptidase [Agromyces lapidis]|uniref:M15 family metallopeptidase n=1 Tax=Agromyces lapidis TaxID=279574 RepID=A0ABV5SU19_9MICO|nr:M15 family metallopeptidase [Agromyces lapidis]